MATFPTQEVLSKLNEPDPEFVQGLQKFFESLPTGEIPDMSEPSTARFYRELEDRKRRDALPQLPVEVSVMNIAMRDGFENEARIFKPQAAQQSAGRPLVVLVYGGGFITGDNNSPTPYAKPIAHLYDAIVVSISYRMTPEFKFPVQAHDVWDNLQWIAKNASRIGADPSAGFVLGGESAGGNVAAVAAAMAQTDRLELPLTGLWLSVPWLLNEAPKGYEEFYQAREQNANAAMINNEVLSMVKRMWCPDFASKNFSPFNNLDVIDDEHPTTYIQVCGLDPLRDDGLIYGRVLDERGVKTKFDLYPGVPHAHWAMFPSIEASKKGMVDAVINIGWLLGKQVEREDIHESLGKLA